MRKHIEKRIKGILASLCFCLLALVFAPGLQSEAAKKKVPSCVKKQTVYLRADSKQDSDDDVEYYIMDVPSSFIYIKNLSSNAKITNLKSTNRKIEVTSYVKGKYWRLNAIQVSEAIGEDPDEGIQPGDKTTISFTVTQNKKKYNLSCTVILKKQPSIFKSFKIGTKNYTSEMNSYVYVDAKKSGSKIKISYKAASGYKIDKIRANYNSGKNNWKSINVKNNQKISTKNLTSLIVYYSVTKKPTNYKKPSKWTTTKISSPLQGWCEVYF